MEQKTNSVWQDVAGKFKQYSISDIFTYTGVSKVRILTQLMKYTLLQALVAMPWKQK